MTATLTLWCATSALISAALAVTRPNVVHGLIWLVATLLALAASFFTLGAAFAGAVQILIYAGAIVAVFVFVIMTFDSSPEAMRRERMRLREGWKLPLLMVLLVVLPLIAGFWSEPRTIPGGGAVSARRLGSLLFGPWAVAIEAASGLLLAALLGARHLAREGDAP